MRFFFRLLVVAIATLSCKDATQEKATREDPRREAELRRRFQRELRLCETFGESQMGTCLQALALEKRAPFLCSQIPVASSWRSECYKRVAAVTGQSLVCLRIEPPSIQAQCFVAAAAVNRDAAACQPLLDLEKKRKKTESAMPAIELGSTEWHVDANYKACAATAQRNVSGCESLDRKNDPDARRLCFQQLAIATGDPSICTRLETEGTSLFVHDCIREIGIRKASREICDRIPEDGGSLAFRLLRECRSAVDLFAKTGVRCDERDPLCNGRIAAANGDLSVCRKLRSYTEIDNCLIAYAYATGDGGGCREMRDVGDAAICQEISGRARPAAAEVGGAPPPEPAPDGRAAARQLAEATERARMDAARHWSRFILDDLDRIERRSEERMRLDLMKAQVSDASPLESRIRYRSAEIALKMRWCNEGDVKECLDLGEWLFQSCQFNQAYDVFLRAKRHVDKTPRALDGYVFDAGVRQQVEVAVSKSDPSRRRDSCATYGLRCCDGVDAEETAGWERLWREYERVANVPFSGLAIEDATERLWLSAVRGVLLRTELASVQGLESIDAAAAAPVRETFVNTAKRFCRSGESIACRVLMEAYLTECRFREAEAAYRAMLTALSAERAQLEGLPRGEVQDVLRKGLKELADRSPNPAAISEQLRALCEQARKGAARP